MLVSRSGRRELLSVTLSQENHEPTTGITLTASFVVKMSHTGAEILPTAPADNDILTVAEVAELLKCKPSFDL